MTALLKRWRADEKLWKPVLVDCPKGLYPNEDADGVEIFENTHFESEDDAWKRLMEESEAFVSMSGHQVLRAEESLLEAKNDAAEATKAFTTTRDNFRKRQWAIKKEETPKD